MTGFGFRLTRCPNNPALTLHDTCHKIRLMTHPADDPEPVISQTRNAVPPLVLCSFLLLFLSSLERGEVECRCENS